ncbi:hypothetical protein GB931_21200 [Modestobacter sp. I12A-02628]|uniref:Uncharacterized protein n=1 Tax=Goekera deserti TaxID=2497753 RepID=A0A7K3WHG5_9ACTN|nr:hypothetical protein [Goekera deserti]MPR00391.1 hypothetical protein [Goekera deserti]NDI50405.1 hypothetical protein [Goekera deserti]NEL55329.1 hypothetical protein [Goekera deserti]
MSMMTVAETAPGALPTDFRSVADLRRAVAAHFTARGMGPDELGAEHFAHLVDEAETGVVRFERARLRRR